ncbi:MAG: hypothetical protein ACFNYI_06180, partial [Eubacterium sp.]
SSLRRVFLSDENFQGYPRRVRQLAAFTLMEEDGAGDWNAISSSQPNRAAYIRKYSRGLMDIAIAGNHLKAASFLLQNMDFSREDLRRFSDRANEEGRTEIMALLLRKMGKRRDGRAEDGEEEMFTW